MGIELLSPEQREHYLYLLEEKDKRECEKSFYYFIRCAWKILEPDTPFQDNWHYRILCEELQNQIIRINNKNPKKYDIIINVPPRSAKSFIVTKCLNAWAWIHNPSLRFLTASYSNALSIEHAKNTRDLILSEWYQRRWGGKFSISEDQNLKSFFSNNKQGHRVATSVGATSTGRGGNIMIIDDGLSREQSISESEVNKCNEWYDKTMSSRLDDRDIGIRIVVMQRLCENDLTGHLMDNPKARYKKFCFPVELCDWVTPEYRRYYDGGLFFPNKFNREIIGFLKDDLGAYGYAGQYMQRPAPAEGEKFKKDWWKFWTKETLPRRFDDKVQSWDMTFKEKSIRKDIETDYVVGQVWGRVGVDKYLLEQIRRRMDFGQTLDAMRELSLMHSDCTAIYIEDQANGEAVKAMLKKEFPNIILVNDYRDKVARAEPYSRQVNAGAIVLPDKKERPWVDEYVEEHAMFPKAKHEDTVDAASLAVSKLTFMPRVCSAYTHDHFIEFSTPMGENFAAFALLKDMRLHGLCFTWNNQEGKLYVYDEMLTYENIHNLPREVYGNDKMFHEGQNAGIFLRKQGINIKQNYNFDEHGSILTLNWLFREKRILIHQNCRELDRCLKGWCLKNNLPDSDSMGIIEALLLIVSILKERGKAVEKTIIRGSYRSIRGRDAAANASYVPPQKQVLKRTGWLA